MLIRTLLLLASYLLCIPLSFSAEYTCVSNDNAMGNKWALPSKAMTLNASIPDYTVLYTVTHSMNAITQMTCDRSNSNSVLSLTLSGVTSADEIIYSGNYIYPTSIPGIGISVVNRDGNNNGVAVRAYPNTVKKGWQIGQNGIGLWVDIKIWKIPSTSGNYVLSGVLDFTGPTLIQGVQLTGSDTFSSSTDMTWGVSSTFWANNAVVLAGSIVFNAGTCNLLMGNQTVQLGIHDNSSNVSQWKDASFSLDCPNAYGYGGSLKEYDYRTSTSGTYGANTVKNNALKITISPYTEILTTDYSGRAIGGTMALDGAGAEGYGVQLAWGDATALTTGEPSSPIIFNTPILASQINSAYTSTSTYPLGTVMPTPVIKMAARFIKTSSVTSGGQARAAIEVIASYD